MSFAKPFLLIIEATLGLNTHAVYTSLDEANSAKDKTFASGQDPICIYNLNSMKYMWENEDFPMYGETIAISIINSYIRNAQ